MTKRLRLVNNVNIAAIMRNKYYTSKDAYKRYTRLVKLFGLPYENIRTYNFERESPLDISLDDFNMVIGTGFDARKAMALYMHSNGNIRIRCASIGWEVVRYIQSGSFGKLHMYFNVQLGMDLESSCNWLFITYSGLGHNDNEHRGPKDIRGKLYVLPLDIGLRRTKRVIQIINSFVEKKADQFCKEFREVNTKAKVISNNFSNTDDMDEPEETILDKGQEVINMANLC